MYQTFFTIQYIFTVQYYASSTVYMYLFLVTMLSPRILIRSFSTAVKKRFYKNVSIVSSSSRQDGADSFEICLDRRKLRTPKKDVLQVCICTVLVTVLWYLQ